MPDPTKVRSGRLGGLKTSRKRSAHLTDVEHEVVRELEQQARGYRNDTHGEPKAVAAWLRALADRLDDHA
jgi:hypothetical protein